MGYERYQLRFAAGLYWLLDMQQDGVDFVQPTTFNESGAYVWRRIERGMKPDEIAKDFGKDYGIEYEEAKADVEGFLRQLHMKGIEFGE